MASHQKQKMMTEISEGNKDLDRSKHKAAAGSSESFYQLSLWASLSPPHYLITHQLNITSYRCDLKNHGKNKDDCDAHDIFCKISLSRRKYSAQHADSGFPWNLEPGVCCIHTSTYAPTAAVAKKILWTDCNQDSP